MNVQGTAIANTSDFTLFVERSKKAKLTWQPNTDIMKRLDYVGTHVLNRALLHGDGDFVRTWWYTKIEGRDDSHEVVLDMRLEDFNNLTRIKMSADGQEWEVIRG